MEWTIKELVEFIVEASLHTYADPTAKTVDVPLRPGCDEYLYERGHFKYHDSYAWSRDGGGEEIVYFNGKPIWLMNYYGYLIGDPDSRSIYGFLHEALAKRHPTLPVRGTDYSRDAFRYEITFEKTEIRNLVGVERIYENDVLVYECYIHGGFIR